MNFSLDALGRLEIESEIVSLRGGLPLLNGILLEDWQAQVTPQVAGFTVRYQAPDTGTALFGVEVHDEGALDGALGGALGGAAGGLPWLRYWVEGLPPEEQLDSFGLRFSALENVRTCLRQGYHSWDGSYYFPAESHPESYAKETDRETGYAMTQLLPHYGRGNLVLGFDRHDRFQHTFTFTRQPLLALAIESLWDRKSRGERERCESERLMIIASEAAEDGLRLWAEQAAAASPAPPRLAGPPITGWSSWYNLYAAISEENILAHLHSAAETARRENLPMGIFQIDDGFTPEMGDWLEVKPQFPRGMRPLLDEIRQAGFIPGLWIAPFVVGNRSRLYRDHPDWVVGDRQTGGPLAQATYYGEFRWHKRSEEYYILDTTHPQASAYLRSVFRSWRQEWGCEYFKADFMYYGSEHGPQRATWHTPGLTRIEIWRRAVEMIREEIGEATLLGCGCPLWAGVGLLDGARIGQDVGVRWRGHHSAASLLRDQATRNFANQVLWQSDPDAILLRERFHHLAEAEVCSLALYAGMTGGVIMTSDDLGELSEGRLRLWRLLLNSERRSCRFPLLENSAVAYQRPAREGEDAFLPAAAGLDPVIVQVRSDGEPDGLAAVLCFNTSEIPLQRSFPLSALGLPGARYTREWVTGEPMSEPIQVLNMLLPAHDARLFFLSSEPLAETPDRLP